MILTDYPKLQCPFIRKNFKVDLEDWEKYGRELQLRSPEVYLAVDEINPGYEWVFEDKETIAVEKLDGSNVKLMTENGRLVALQNRKNIIDPLQIIKGKTFIIEGVFQAIGKGYVNHEGEQAGELIGPKVQGNPYKLLTHLWYPFLKSIKHLSYRSFHEHERTFENWSSWFKDWLPSRFATKCGNEDIMAEGVIFYNLKRKSENRVYRAKLRRDMFEWYYSDTIRIYDYKS
ncbi:MAG TPA: hypothetical protein VMX17_11460 [Candidatus Glassbacteria bacterium]|nr:hypothetical protein [Candidatus Glassbacteria bacterium]